MPIEFTEEQKNIFQFVQNENGHGIIDAVAGAGKTTTIMQCVSYVQDKSNVLFCAFNNSIAKEIRNKFIQRGFPEITVKTIHALGLQILRDNNNSGIQIQLEESKYSKVIESEKIKALFEPYHKDLLKIQGFDPDEEFDRNKQFAAKKILNQFKYRLLEINQKYRTTLTNNNIENLRELVEHFNIFNHVELNKAHFNDELKIYFDCHNILLEEANSLSNRTMKIDFTDMLYLPYVWKQFPIRKFNFLFIDECQDLSKSQLAIAAKYGAASARILAVGDPRQSIYGFTGADINSFNRVKNLTKAQNLPLTKCFRCPKKVIEIAKTIRQDIEGVKANEGQIHKIYFEEIIHKSRANDLIISRLKAPLVILIFQFIEKEIKVQIHEAEVKDIINDLKTIFKKEELRVILSTLEDGFSSIKEQIKNRWNWIIHNNAERIIDSVERQIYIESEKKYIENKLDFFHKKSLDWSEDCPNILSILKKIKEYITEQNNPIKLSTIHRAKGLENSRVFILDYDKLPFERLEQKEWEKIQESNLKYVGVTRALDELYLVITPDLNKIKDEGSLFDELPFE